MALHMPGAKAIPPWRISPLLPGIGMRFLSGINLPEKFRSTCSRKANYSQKPINNTLAGHEQSGDFQTANHSLQIDCGWGLLFLPDVYGCRFASCHSVSISSMDLSDSFLPCFFAPCSTKLKRLLKRLLVLLKANSASTFFQRARLTSAN